MLSKVDHDHSDYYSIFNQLTEILHRPSIVSDGTLSIEDYTDLHDLARFILLHAPEYIMRSDLYISLDPDSSFNDENGLLYR